MTARFAFFYQFLGGCFELLQPKEGRRYGRWGIVKQKIPPLQSRVWGELWRESRGRKGFTV